VVLIGCLIVGILYAVVVFDAVHSTPENHHVQHHSTR
jgi:hypothetical protein